MNSRIDLERHVSEWLRDEAPGRAPEHVLSLALDRVAVVGQERSLRMSRYRDRSGSDRTLLIAATVALLAVALAAAVFVGGQLLLEEAPLPVPSAQPEFTPTPPPVPFPVGTTILGSGAASSELGPLSWTSVAGDSTNIPSTEIFAAPAGFAAIEADLDGSDSRFWVSPDGIAWTVGSLPVPARGLVRHALVAGEHWIWSESDFRIWRSSDFWDWTEVDVASLRPPPIEGVRWSMNAGAPVTAGSTTVMRWDLIGRLALDELLGVELEPDESIMFGAAFDDATPLGVSRPVYRAHQTPFGPDEATRTLVGEIRVELRGQTAIVMAEEPLRVLIEVDATQLGVPADEMAQDLNAFGFVRGSGEGVVMARGGVQPLRPPAAFANLVAVNETFVAWTDDRAGGPRIVWSSTDGMDWAELGPMVLPSPVQVFQVLPTAPALGLPLAALAMVDEGGEQRNELWSSSDGQTWSRLSVISTYPEPNFDPHPGPVGFVAPGDDQRLHVSPSGNEWSVVDGPAGLHQTVDEHGGTQVLSVTPDTVFYVELPLTGERRLWKFKFESVPGQPSAAPLEGG
jgi:hypothetical protein